MEIKLCPYCEQDDLWRVSIPGIDDNAAICKECDTIWTHDEKIEDGSGINFRKFMS
jgi:RNA polymerase subunit RPABC4/transcription elongation factor Spt4